MREAAMTDDGMRSELLAIDDTLARRKVGGPEATNMKKRARTLKNRLAAKRSREAKKEWVKDLEERVRILEQENAALKSRLATLPPDSISASPSNTPFGNGITTLSTPVPCPATVTGRPSNPNREPSTESMPCPPQGLA